MHTVELLQETIALAARLGYQVRQEWLGGNAGGDCEINGRKWIFLDVTLGPTDQLALVLDALRRQPGVLALPMSPALRELLQVRRSA